MPLYRSNRVIELELSGPLGRAWRNRRKRDRERFHATLTFPDAAGRTSVPVRLRVAGRTRAQRCEVPPYELTIDPTLVAGTLLEGQRLMRVFTHCRDDRRYEQLAIEEYLVYRILNLLTEWSYRARMVRMKYRDTERSEAETYFAIFTEHEEQLAARIGFRPLELESLSLNAVEPNQAALLGVFNYLVGNTDFSVLRGPPGGRCCHNVQLLGVAGGPVIPVPYDFDSAGLVDAPYAAPHENLPIHSVRDRHFWGYCQHNAYVPRIVAAVAAAQPRIEELYLQQDGLDPERAEGALAFLGEFFAMANDPERVAEELLESCR